MTKKVLVKVPDIGDFKDVEIIEILVKSGDTVEAEAPLITLESDKATIDVPTPIAGRIKSIKVEVGDRISEGSEIVEIEPIEQPKKSGAQIHDPRVEPDLRRDSERKPAAPAEAQADIACDLLVLGSGPGGYTAAFRAADLGLDTILVERFNSLGGVCLNVGCIPSKALLHAARIIGEAKDMSPAGVTFGTPDIDLGKLLEWKRGIVGKLTGGLAGLARQRKVRVVTGNGRFIDPHHLQVTTGEGERTLRFDQAIVAAGSSVIQLPGIPDDPRIMDSTAALELEDIPGKLLIIGGGIIGLEMATVYHALGSRITVVEMLDSLIAGADPDIVRPLYNRIRKQYDNIYLETRVTGIKAGKKLVVSFDGPEAPEKQQFDRVLVAVGRKPNGAQIGAERAGVAVNERGFIEVDEQMRTNVRHIYAIGDIVGQPMLAHKASHEGKTAAEVAAGMKSGLEARVIPSVAYTDPEVAWVGMTEIEAQRLGLKFGKGTFPWAASGRALSINRGEGLTKLLFDQETGQLIGAGIVGPAAGDLIAETALAIEMGCDAQDIGLTIHPHPTLSETIGFSAEVFEGTITDLYLPKKK